MSKSGRRLGVEQKAHGDAVKRGSDSGIKDFASRLELCEGYRAAGHSAEVGVKDGLCFAGPGGVELMGVARSRRRSVEGRCGTARLLERRSR